MGDILSIEVGDVIGADGISLSGNVKVDESSLTGKAPVPVRLHLLRLRAQVNRTR